jgi:hypothetical protein
MQGMIFFRSSSRRRQALPMVATLTGPKALSNLMV